MKCPHSPLRSRLHRSYSPKNCYFNTFLTTVSPMRDSDILTRLQAHFLHLCKSLNLLCILHQSPQTISLICNRYCPSQKSENHECTQERWRMQSSPFHQGQNKTHYWHNYHEFIHCRTGFDQIMPPLLKKKLNSIHCCPDIGKGWKFRINCCSEFTDSFGVGSWILVAGWFLRLCA